MAFYKTSYEWEFQTYIGIVESQSEKSCLIRTNVAKVLVFSPMVSKNKIICSM